MSELVSVIVPVYRVEEYLNRCVESIVQQSYQNLEILLIDDGSPDNCPRMCDDWAKKDSRIIVIHQKNAGLSAARNTGIHYAKGQYLSFVDSDDYLSKDFVLALYDSLHSANAELAICDFEKGEEGNHLFPDESYCHQVITPKEALHAIYESSQRAQMFVAAWGKLYQRELFDNIQYPTGKLFEDIYITHKVLYKCRRIAVVPQKLLYYYQRPDSIMNSKLHIKKLDYLEALKERIDFFRDNELHDLESIAYDEYLHALIWEYSRARDLLKNRDAMQGIIKRFRDVYRKGYSSKRFPTENAKYLAAFNCNPELIVAYWKINAGWKKLFKNSKNQL